MNPNLRKIIFFVILIGLAFVAYTYMIKPANESLIVQKTAMEQKRAKLQELENATITADDLNKQLVQMEEVIKVFESKLPVGLLDVVIRRVTAHTQNFVVVSGTCHQSPLGSL